MRRSDSRDDAWSDGVLEYCKISNPKHPTSRCQVSEKIDLNTETLVSVICLESLDTPTLHCSKEKGR